MVETNTPNNRAKARISRRDMLAGLAAGTVITIVPTASASDIDELDRIIHRARSLRSQFHEIEKVCETISVRPDRPRYPAIRLAEIDKGSYFEHTQIDFRQEWEIREYFERYRRCLFGNLKSKLRHLANEDAAIELLRRRIEARQRWDEATGLAELSREETRLCELWLAAEREAFLYPCTTFSMVARKVAFIRETIDDQDFTPELGMAVIYSMDGVGVDGTTMAK